MKITQKQYAILLYEMTKEAKKKEIEERTQDFLNLLLKHRTLNQLPKILQSYAQYYNVQEKVVDVEVTTAREVGKPVEAAFKSPQDGLKTAATFTIDPAVIGGARIRIGDYMVDDTIRARLMQLRKNVSAKH